MSKNTMALVKEIKTPAKSLREGIYLLLSLCDRESNPRERQRLGNSSCSRTGMRLGAFGIQSFALAGGVHGCLIKTK